MAKQPIYKPKAKPNGKLFPLLGITFFLLIWQILSLIVGNQILLPGPLAVVLALGQLIFKSRFWLGVLYSLLSIASGFIVGTLIAILLGHLAFFFSWTEILFSPLIYIFKSAPLAALTIILMIWLKTSVLPFVLILIAIIPPIYYATKSGLEGASSKLLEMSFVFNMGKYPVYRTIYLPAFIKEILPSLNYTSGLAWKAGITGEIMTQPFSRLGTNLYSSKIQLESAEVLAYLAVILLLSLILNKIISLLCRSLLQNESEKKQEDLFTFQEDNESADDSIQPVASTYFKDVAQQSSHRQNDLPEKPNTTNLITIKNLDKSYEGKKIISDFSCEIALGSINFIMGPSGKGKTTFFRLLSGLELPDSGEINFLEKPVFSYAFQDVRLLENLTLSENLMFTCHHKLSKSETAEFLKYWESIMIDLGLPIDQKIKTYSGGMKQKASLIRALAHDSNIIILDEVFRELDQKSEQQILQLLNQEKGQRTVLMASHRQDLIEQFDGRIILL